MTRINKFIANNSGYSRRKADELIQKGSVKVNGKVCRELGLSVTEGVDKVEIEGQLLNSKVPLFYVMLNKPVGYVSSRSDEFDRKTVYDLLPQDLHMLKNIGRLDMDSSGLLLFTNDGDLINKYLHPKYKVEKVYLATVAGKLSKYQLDTLRDGVNIGDYITQPCGVYLRKSYGDNTNVKLVITEGKKRQIRRMIESVESRVIKLKRTQIGDIKLGSLKSGEWKFLSATEIASLKAGANKQ